MTVGSNLGQVQAFNRRIVLEMIRVHGPISRAEITRRTSLTRQTISNIVADLSRARMIVVTGQQRPEGGGKPSDELEINPSGVYSVGVNLYLDELTGVLLDLAGTIHQRVHRHISLPTPEGAAPVIKEVVNSLLAAEGIQESDLWGAGIGLPGPLSTVYHPEQTALSAWREAAVVEEFREILGVPVFIENNANAGAIGERWYGAGQHVKSFVYFSFGLFIGGGVVLNAQLYTGSGGFAAEFGDAPTSVSGEGGRYKSLSEVASPAVLLERLEESGERGVEVEDLAGLFEKRHPLVLEWMADATRHIAPLITTLEYVLDPEAVVFGGRLPEPLLRDFVARLGATLPAFRTQNKPYELQLLVSKAGGDAAALGAATLPLYQTLDPNPSGYLGTPTSSTKTNESSIREQLLNT